MSKINEALVMMAEQKETFEVNGKKFQVIEVKDAEQQPDYSHLVGKFVRCVDTECEEAFTNGKWYECVGNPNNTKAFISNLGTRDGFSWDKTNRNSKVFDLSNPSDTNPDEKKVWEKANEKMWDYGFVNIGVKLKSEEKSHEELVSHLHKEWKHIRAYLFLSKFADLCNEGRVVDWVDEETNKYVVNAVDKRLQVQHFDVDVHHIAFLDEEARDYSLKVHEQIWKDYWGIE